MIIKPPENRREEMWIIEILEAIKKPKLIKTYEM